MTRLSYTQRLLLDLFRQLHPEQRQLSYDDLACRVNADRRTVISAVRALEYHQRLRIQRGHGGVANRYEVTDA